MTSKTLIYKIARFNSGNEKRTLQQLLESALKKKKSAMARLKTGESESQFSLINYHGPHKQMRVAEFIEYTAGLKQPFAKIDKTAEELPISSLAPPDKQSEFLGGILYFGTFKNSVIISQASALRAAQLEQYLNWLLMHCGLIKEGEFLTLSDHPPLAAGEEIVNAKGISFEAPVSLIPLEKGDKGFMSKELAYKPSNRGWEALKQLFPEEFKLPGLVKAKEIVGDAELKVTVHLSWSKLRKDDPTDFIDRISNTLRHIEDEVDYSVITRSGTISKDQIKLRIPITVKENKDGLLIKLDMWEKMEEWLVRLIQEKRIDPSA